jgi:predicted amidohydrolase
VLVLPETWNTGFFPKENLQDHCDKDGAQVKQVFGALAAKYGVNIISGSVSNLRNGKVYNTAMVFDRSGACIASYDKTHLFTPMGEDDYFQKGDHVARFQLDSAECGIIICYDVRFPELTRTLTVPGLDMLFVVSQWPKVRTFHLRSLTTARAIENQMFVVCCNSCGTYGQTVYGGSSAIIDPWGETIALAGETQQLLTADCDLQILENIRSTIPVFRDRRPELYNI